MSLVAQRNLLRAFGSSPNSLSSWSLFPSMSIGDRIPKRNSFCVCELKFNCRNQFDNPAAVAEEEGRSVGMLVACILALGGPVASCLANEFSRAWGLVSCLHDTTRISSRVRLNA
eukprot:SAG31_NODE_194_length_20722_cov_19.854192_24_plen_115_part_00